MKDAEHATGVPYSTGLHEPFEAARFRHMVDSAEADAKAYQWVKHTKRERRKVMGDYLMGTPEERAVASQLLSKGEIEQTRAIKEVVLDPLFQRWYGTDSSRFFNEIVPKFRAARTTDPKALYPQGGAPKETGLLDLVGQTDMTNPLERDVARMMASVIRGGFWKEHVDGAYKEAVKFMNSPAVHREMKPLLEKWMRSGSESSMVNNFGRIYQRAFALMGHEVDRKEAQNVVTTWMSLTHAGLLGGRPGPLIRNMFAGPTVSAPRIGNKWYRIGMQQSMTKEGKKLFDESFIPHEQATILDKLNTVTAGPVSGGAQKVARVLLAPYSKVDLVPRSHAFLGGRARILDAIERMPKDALRSKDIDKFDNMFLTESAVYRLHPVLQRQVRDLWRAGKTQEAARRGGIAFQQDSQWVYRQGFRPLIMSSDDGRAIGQFGIWPINYMEYFGQMTRMIAFPEKWGIVPGYKEAVRTEGIRWATEWGINNAAVALTFAGLGTAVGMGPDALKHTLGWTVGGPFFGGGPALDLFTGLTGMLYEMVTLRPGQAMETTARTLEGAIPPSGLLKDAAKASGQTLRILPRVTSSKKSPLGMKIKPPGLSPSKSYAKPRSTAEFLFRGITGAQRRK
jgi:hypothetical protein